MTRTVVLLLVLAAVAAAGCHSTASTGDEILAGTASTAFFVGDIVRGVFWEVPKFLLWTLPKGVFCDLPTWIFLHASGNRAVVEERIGRLASGELSLEEEVSVSEDLRHLTGLPIESAERWIEWWDGAREQPESEWRVSFVTAAIDALTADDYFARSEAIEDLKAVYGTDLQYDAKSGPEALAASADRWREHLDAHGVPPLDE